mgnify:CR=1 FL=1
MKRPSILPPDTVVRAPRGRFQARADSDDDGESERYAPHAQAEILHTIPCVAVASYVVN